MNKRLILITGLGGSGTRLYGQILKSLGVFMGKSINVAEDNIMTVKIVEYYRKHYKKLESPAGYNGFKELFNDIITKSGYNNKEIFCIKSPPLMFCLEPIIKFCEEEGYKLEVIHVIRDGKYMINGKTPYPGKIEQWGFKYENKFKSKEYKLKKVEFWFWANWDVFGIRNKNNTKFKMLVLGYDNMISNPDSEIQKILEFLEFKNVDLSKLNNFKTKLRSRGRVEKVDILKLPEYTQDLIRKMNKFAKIED